MLMLLFLSSLAALFSVCQTQQLHLVNDWGKTPTEAAMYLRQPSSPTTNPAIVVLIHGCLGSAQVYYGSTRDFHSLADQKGIYLIYPDMPSDSHCWDVASQQSLTREGGGDSTTIVNMVRYAIKKYNVNPDRVFVSGWSSGGMMTNVLAATYPDVFKAAASLSGCPHGCLAQKNATPKNRHSSPFSDGSGCPQARVSKTGAEWEALVKSAYPGYNGSYPKMQLWHGTSDAIVSYKCFTEAQKEWGAVFGIQMTKNISSDPQAGYTKSVYGDGTKLVAYSASGVGHMDIPSHGAQILEWFGL